MRSGTIAQSLDLIARAIVKRDTCARVRLRSKLAPGEVYCHPRR